MTETSKEKRLYTGVQEKRRGSFRGNKGEHGHMTSGLLEF